MNAPREVSHDDIVVSMFKADPAFAEAYLVPARKPLFFQKIYCLIFEHPRFSCG
jgi:hypothetical protein